MATTYTTTYLNTGTIYIKSNPVGADVYIDGELYGPSPLRLNDTEPGTHTYLLRASGYSDYTGQIIVKEGEVSPEFVMMSPSDNKQYYNRQYQSAFTDSLNQYNQQNIQSLQTTIPTSQHGYTVISDTTIMIGLGIALAVAIGILIGKYFLKKE